MQEKLLHILFWIKSSILIPMKNQIVTLAPSFLPRDFVQPHHLPL